VTPVFFLDPKARTVYETILKHKTKYGAVPSLSAFKSNHPDYKLVVVDDTYDYLVDEIRRARKLAIFEETLSAATEAWDSQDDVTIQHILAQGLLQVAAELPNSRDTDLTKTGQDRLERYRELAADPGGLKGIPSGITVIDRATGGFQNSQLVVVAGPPKAGKSTLALMCAMAAHQYGLRPLFIGFEMTNHEQEERHDAIGAQISHTRLQQGKMRKEDWTALEKFVRTNDNMQSFWVSEDTNSATTLSGVAAKVETHKPDFIVIDGVYMMDDENGEKKGSPQALTNLTRGLKRLAQNARRPILITTQVLESKMSHSEGVTSASIGYSSSFAQDADVLLGIQKDTKIMGDNINKIKVLLARNCPPLECFVEWNWDKGSFTELESRPLDDDDHSPSSSI
jgi:replicative DNA helicase